MKGCKDCNFKDRVIRRLSDSAKNYKFHHKEEMKRNIALHHALQAVYEISKNNMWYPCSFEDHEKVDASQQAWISADMKATKYEGYEK